ncbi:MAG: hypothetical protein FJ271_11070 [Planctomycetes bacterium]|nr:hypothetical protein [Planctomycetota bacterium]
MTSRVLIVSGFWLVVSGFSVAQDHGVTFLVQNTEGTPGTGVLQQFDAQGVRLRGGVTQPLTDVARIRRHLGVLPPFPRRNVVILTNGNHLPWADKDSRLEEGRLHLTLAEAKVRLPRSFVSIIWLAPPDGMDANLMVNRLIRGRRPLDVLYLRNNDRLKGRLLEIGEKGFTMETGNRALTIDAARVACLALNTDLQARFRPVLPYYHVILEDGSRLDFASFKLDASADRFEGKTLFGARLALLPGRIAAIDPRHDRIDYLSDLKPKQYEHTPYLDLTWPLALDTTVTGQPLVVHGDTFDKGLGMHAKSVVSYDLKGRYRRFDALAAMDAHVAPKGTARVRVLIDGKEQDIGAKKELSARDELPLVIQLDVRKARVLTLVTDFGSAGDVQARVNWADCRLTR